MVDLRKSCAPLGSFLALQPLEFNGGTENIQQAAVLWAKNASLMREVGGERADSFEPRTANARKTSAYSSGIQGSSVEHIHP